MSLFPKLFGGKSPKTSEPETYEGFRIIVDPIKEGGTFRLAATIEKEVGGELKSHRLIRADTFQSEEEARRFSLRKAQQMIDQMGDKLFG